MINFLPELVNPDGSKISGDKKIDQSNTPTKSKMTTDDAVKAGRQKGSRYMVYRRFYGESKEPKHPIFETFKNSNSLDEFITSCYNSGYDGKTISDSIKKFYGKKSMDESNENVLEDIFNNRNDNSDILNKEGEMMDLEFLKESNPLIVRKLNNLIDVIQKNELTGEEKGVLLNYLFTIDLTDIPLIYKKELIKQLK